ncbi:MAG: thioredoxin [Candidatus Bathyarchaeia archaeon]
MASNAPVHTSEQSFDSDVIKADVPVLADFYADWCGPCKVVAPIIDDLSKQYAGKMRFVKVNVDENADLAAKYGVQGIPTLIFFKGGQPVGRIVGAPPRGRLVQQIDKTLGE